MDKNMELPEGWKCVKLGNVCKKIIGGGTPSTKNNEYWGGNIPWISSADIQGLKEIVPRKMITLKGLENSTTNILPKGGIIVVTRVGLGKIAITPYDIAFSQDNQGLVLDENLIDQAYALICLSRAVQSFKHQSRGTTINGVTKKQLVELEIPLPSIREQIQIVQKIEELFSELDKGIENLKTAQEQLKVYRQAVLKWAFEGKLTNENVKDGELPEGWEWKKLKDISDNIQYGYTESSSLNLIGPKFLRITDIQDGKVNWKNVPYCKIKEGEKNKYLLKDGDLVFARTGATVGKSYLIKGDIPEAVFASYLIRVRVSKQINERYLSAFFNSSIYWSQITEGQVGIGQPNVNGTKLGNLKVPLAPISKQESIVQEIESRLSVCDKIEETITSSLQQAEALRQSILKKAFGGKLVKEDEQTLQPQLIGEL
ncbi:hypothetical protein DIU31_020040 [Mucilaginibacter rubeus]|uniref:Restriction endonuclease subunit S n=1 Tax=Mucilaginibacter rubeus TaxID=2027860 RepID=A0AAE6MJX7_9SPHI|nr:MULTISPECIES: restriction endonuclease subunit S [Mucilaginibacter]QEM05692.1 hypothetical protein DIU31_020040 [Mucilaginibacter rubeus]QEM18280.1 hypothetical protein DIU38_020250 [Mucilaginibacter gossypii]QTE45187.1 restriction endonuclease subunit S [Mucilaginibacter rubeus]QTE51783.1 restriction endonuclease subunit S [Mucilaginibacter rubeus]QTE56870.1 restriction endonuclease subunit S [Mucilaginibacter rubeus]